MYARLRLLKIVACALVLASPLRIAWAQAHNDTTLRICGSPQMSDLLHLLEQAYQRAHPGKRFDEDLVSTITAVAGIQHDTADVCLLGRELWPEEAAAFRTARGHEITVLPVATGSYDVPKATFALMVFVPADLPLRSLSFAQLRRVFSDASPRAATWSDLGVRGPRAGHAIHLYGFAKDNDKARIFSDLVFKHGEGWNPALYAFANDADLDAGEKITRAVAADPDGIGISNAHYANKVIRAVPLIADGATTAVAPSRASVAAHTYPLTREVYLVADPLRVAADPALASFLRFAISAQGQRAVAAEGNYLPLPQRVMRSAANQLQYP